MKDSTLGDLFEKYGSETFAIKTKTGKIWFDAKNRVIAGFTKAKYLKKH